jgi:hypothetical protein
MKTKISLQTEFSVHTHTHTKQNGPVKSRSHLRITSGDKFVSLIGKYKA